jgi:hypothetical protein
MAAEEPPGLLPRALAEVEVTERSVSVSDRDERTDETFERGDDVPED